MSVWAELQRQLGFPVERGASLAGRTSLKLGGAADGFAVAPDAAGLARALELCRQSGLGCQLLGGGTNTLVSDEGVRGLVLRPGDWPQEESCRVEGAAALLRLSAGAPLKRLLALARQAGCVGGEFWAGIPGTVGGAVVMNAGTPAGSTGERCLSVGLCAPGRGDFELPAAEVGFAYRRTALPAGAAVSWACFRLPLGDEAARLASEQAMAADLERRRRTQPLGLPNAGSFFRNPPGEHAGRLIEAAGLKGERQGGAQVSELHANFIVNRGGATAADVLGLMRRVQQAVEERSGLLLVPEVKLLGVFDPAALPRGLTVEERAA